MSDGFPSRLYIFGASGSGTTTLGLEVARALSLIHVDCDDHYWAIAQTPFSKKRTPEERMQSMRMALGDKGWLLTGACNGWGAEVIEKATLLVFVTLPTTTRIERLVQRERECFGHRVEKGGDMYEIHRDFLTWASKYDDPKFSGRSFATHENWLREQTKPICRIDGSQRPDMSAAQILAKIKQVQVV